MIDMERSTSEEYWTVRRRVRRRLRFIRHLFTYLGAERRCSCCWTGAPAAKATASTGRSGSRWSGASSWRWEFISTLPGAPALGPRSRGAPDRTASCAGDAARSTWKSSRQSTCAAGTASACSRATTTARPSSRTTRSPRPQRWVEQGAPRLHIVDLDGARDGTQANARGDASDHRRRRSAGPGRGRRA